MIAASAMDLDQLSRHFVSDFGIQPVRDCRGKARRCSLPNILRGFNTTTGCDCMKIMGGSTRSITCELSHTHTLY